MGTTPEGNQLTWKFGLYGKAFSETRAHWFFDDYWSEEKKDHQHVAVQVTNQGDTDCFLSKLSVCLINCDSGGNGSDSGSGQTSFKDSSGVTHSTCASVATIKAHCNGCDSTSAVSADSKDGTFHYSASNGQSYWSPRPSNAAGTPLSEDCSHVTYVFEFPASGVEVKSQQSVVVTFTATWSAGSEHCIQIYAQHGISVYSSPSVPPPELPPAPSPVIWRYHASNKEWKKELFPYRRSGEGEKWERLENVQIYGGSKWGSSSASHSSQG